MHKSFPFSYSLCLLLFAQNYLFSHSSPVTCAADDQLVACRYPGAQIWYQAMMKKYPQAHLEKILFAISDNYESGDGIIFFPEFRLQEMDKIFGAARAANLTQEMFAPFAEDEYLLLHEAMHVLQKDVVYGSVATALAYGSVLSVALGSALNYKNQTMEAPAGIVTTACVATVAYTCLIMYARFQEYRADHFANQNADIQALRAGKNWFNRLHTFLSFENIMIPDCFNSFSQFLQDPVHPTPKIRASKIVQALMLRFGQIA